MGAVAIYLLLALIFATGFSLIGLYLPGAFRGDGLTAGSILGASSLYFSFVSLTSVGYGDIVPVHPAARSLANLVGVIGQLYPATIIARLVTLHLSAQRG